MSKTVSPYYPPRAGWRAPLSRLDGWLRRRLALRHVRRPKAVSASSFFALVGSLLVPGLGFYFRGARFWGKALVGVSCVLAMAFLAWLGHPAGNVAFGLLLSIHCTGAVYYFEPQLAGESFGRRIFVSFGVLMLGGMIYMSLRSVVQERYFMPMTIRERVVIVRPSSATESIRRGDWIAYSLSRSYQSGIYLRAGYGLSPVLAVARDRVRFGKTALEVNGVQMPRQAQMPDSGEFVVSQNSCFVWPEFDIRSHGVSEGALLTTLREMGMIKRDQLIGKPFKRWFWRRQKLP